MPDPDENPPAPTPLTTACLAAIAAILASSPASAQEPEFHSADDDLSTWSFVWENDYFSGTDRNYTNGVRLAYLSGFKTPHGLTKFCAENLLGAGPDTGVRRGFAVGHSIFTPEDTQATAPLPDQHPYAGWLYGEYSVVVEQPGSIDQFTIQAGVVGPAAAGEWVQNNWHELINGAHVNGWDNQIGNEPGIVVSYDRIVRAERALGDSALSVDVAPTFGLSLGNIETQARVGLMFRFGDNLRNDYGPPRVRPSLAGGGFFSPVDAFSWYVFAGAEGRAVAHSIFLDGSLFDDDDPGVASKTFVGDFQGGLVMQFRRVQIAYTYVLRTKEFEGQPDSQQFGAVSISAKF